MAVAKSVCSECGADLSPGDDLCSQCGARIEWEKKDSVQSAQVSPLNRRGNLRLCSVCGHQNENAGIYCESCGARVPTGGEPAVVDSHGRPERKPAGQKGDALANAGKKVKDARRERRKMRRKAPGPKFEPWQVVAGIVIIGLGVFFVYNEITRVQPPPQVHAHENLPAQTAGLIQDVGRLQKIVDANPNDSGSMLRLANTLHDLSRHDGRLLFRAIDAYQKYLRMKPDDPDARVDLGIVYFELAKVDSANAGQFVTKAIKEMETVAASHPTHQAAVFNLGIVNLNAGDMEESNKWFRKTVELNAASKLGQDAKRLLEQHSF